MDFEKALMLSMLSPEEQKAFIRLEKERQKEMVKSGKWERYTTGVGQKVLVHAEKEDCRENGCAIHNPTPHSMSEFPLVWRSDWGGFFERLCPHGVGLVDPNHVAWVLRTKSREEALTCLKGQGQCSEGCGAGAYDWIEGLRE